MVKGQRCFLAFGANTADHLRYSLGVKVGVTGVFSFGGIGEPEVFFCLEPRVLLENLFEESVGGAGVGGGLKYNELTGP